MNRPNVQRRRGGQPAGVVLAQFEQTTIADGALHDLASYAERGAVLPLRSRSFTPTLRSFGLDFREIRRLAAGLNPDAIALIARVPRGEHARAILRILWREGAANLAYAPVSFGRSTTRSSPKDQSAKASISTST